MMSRSKLDLDKLVPESYRSGAAAAATVLPPPPRTKAGPNLNNILLQSRGEPPASPAPAPVYRAPPVSSPALEFARNFKPEPPPVAVPPPVEPRPTEQSPIESLMDDIMGLDPDIQHLFSSEVDMAQDRLFVNNMPIPLNAQEIGYEPYVGSVLQFIFTNQALWRFFISPNIVSIIQLMRTREPRNGLTDTQIHSFILIIKYIYLLYSSRESIRNVNECVHTWTDAANAAYNVLCKHMMMLIRNRNISVGNFEELFSIILDCMPNFLKPSIVDNGAPETKFLKLPLLGGGSLQDYLTTNHCQVQVTDDKIQTFFVAFYNPGQENHRDEVSESQCPETVTLGDGTIYRKLIHIDTRYYASIASPRGDSGEYVFATNSTGVGSLEDLTFRRCTAFFNKFKPPNVTSRLVVMYTPIPPQSTTYQRVKNVVGRVATGAAAATAAAAAFAAAAFGYGWHQADFGRVN
jgi:hypothetical protein